ncbi:hypothetical protein [Edaphobacter dinghuensis]|uniref:Uncharacterized protein n=1 Tax=Edaphobacter dinghuensis TaxID=1560005 RepID=A0A917MBD1_9BACT|nr:hypothetical protein [Edaphobacter dinghuensis]GGG87020.1 hypothetical protein GCM10011585_33780 [Edaphobacter dinghuensis]
MAIFIIEVPELHWSKREIDAGSIGDAFRKANTDTEFNEIGLQFDRSFLPDEQAWEGYSAENENLKYRFDGQTVDAI